MNTYNFYDYIKNLEGARIKGFGEDWSNNCYFDFTYKNQFYYVGYSDFEGVIIIPYIIKGFNKKIQADYPITINNIEDLEKIFLVTYCNPVDDVFVQDMTMDFNSYRKINENEFKNCFERVDMGYREKMIYNNRRDFELLQDHVYRIYNLYDDYFDIDTKNLRITG